MIRTTVTVGEATREVAIVDARKSFICGFIGTRGWFEWDTQKYPLPRIKLKGKGEVNFRKTRELAKSFLEPVVRELQEGKKSPVHLEPSSKEGQGKPSNKPNGYVSGVAKWMLKLKVWTPCYCRKTGKFLYYRRTRYYEEYKELIEGWLPFCSVCIYRAGCEHRCDNPEENVRHKIL